MRREAITGSNLSAKTAILTPRQREIFEFVKSNIMNRGYGPTVREIGNEFGIKSPNGGAWHPSSVANLIGRSTGQAFL